MKKSKLFVAFLSLFTLVACGGSESSVSPSSLSDSTSVKESDSSTKESSSVESSLDSSNDESSYIHALDGSSIENAIPLTLNQPGLVSNTLLKLNDYWYTFSITTAGTYSIKMDGGDEDFDKKFKLYDSDSETVLLTGSYTKATDYSTRTIVDYDFQVGTYFLETFYDDSKVPENMYYGFTIGVYDQIKGYSIATAIDIDMNSVTTTGFTASIEADEYVFYKFNPTLSQYLVINATNNSGQTVHGYLSSSAPTLSKTGYNYEVKGAGNADFDIIYTELLDTSKTYYLYFDCSFDTSISVKFTYSIELPPDGTKENPFNFKENNALSAVGETLTAAYSNDYTCYKFIPSQSKYISFSASVVTSYGIYLYLFHDAIDTDHQLDGYAFSSSDDYTFSNQFVAGDTYYIVVASYQAGDSVNLKFTYLDALPEDGTSVACAKTVTTDALSTGEVFNVDFDGCYYKYTATEDDKYLSFNVTANSNYGIYVYCFKDYASAKSSNSCLKILGTTTFSATMTDRTVAGQTYYFYMYSYYNETGTFTITLTDDLPKTGSQVATGLDFNGDPSSSAVNISYGKDEVYYQYTAKADDEGKYLKISLSNVHNEIKCSFYDDIFSEKDDYVAREEKATNFDLYYGLPLESGKTYVIGFSSYYSNFTFDVQFILTDTKDESGTQPGNAKTLDELTAFSSTGIDVTLNKSYVFYEYTPTQTGYVTIDVDNSLNNSGSAYIYWKNTYPKSTSDYSTGSETYLFVKANEDKTFPTKYVEAGKTYYLWFYSSYSLTINVSFSFDSSITADGTSMAKAVECDFDSVTGLYDASSIVANAKTSYWFKFTIDDSQTGTYKFWSHCSTNDVDLVGVYDFDFNKLTFNSDHYDTKQTDTQIASDFYSTCELSEEGTYYICIQIYNSTITTDDCYFGACKI